MQFHGRRFAELPAGRVRSEEVWPSENVPLPPLPVGRHMLARMAVHEVPGDVAWDAPGYRSVAACRFECHDALLHSSAGILCLDETVVTDTLDHTAGFIHHYELTQDGIALPRRPDAALAGTHVAVLAGGHDNYYHWTTECLGRLALVGAALESGATLLMPLPSAPFHAPSLELVGAPRLRFLAPDETLRVEHLILPWTVVGQHCPAPGLAPFLARLGAMAPRGGAARPRRLYIDRRGSATRRLVNEAEVAAALARLGFEAVRLEALPLAEQIRLFAGAQLIVAPHGAGLANLFHARPGCQVVELQMDTWVNACFRRIAAICGLDYDCVIGRQGPERAGAVQQGSYALTGVHAQVWEVSVTHVLGAVEQALARR
jgi:capsular polysaccharide biosynthesis protein